MSKGNNMLRHNSIRISLVFLVALFIFGCDTKKHDIKNGDTAPQFSAADVSGGTISLSQNKGRTVVLYFWINSCCGDSLKLVEPFYRANKRNNLEVIAINVGDTKEVVTSYAKSNGLTFPMLADEHSTIYKQYQVFGFPTIFIIDKHGIIRGKVLGNIQNAQLEKLIQHHIDIQKKAEDSYEKTHSR